MDTNFTFQIEEFLRKRGIEEHILTTMGNEKIDLSVITIMTDEELSKYIHAYGDRIALKQFCNKKLKTEIPSKKLTILERLRKKVSGKFNSSSSDEEKELTCRKRKRGNEKQTRQVEIGWMCSINGDRYMQVKSKNGGGTRKVQIPKTAKKIDLIDKGIDLFFPKGQSTKGDLEKFTINLLDFKSHVIEDHLSVEEMFEQTSLARLRVYLATKEKTRTVVSNKEDTVPPELEVSNREDTIPSELEVSISNNEDGNNNLQLEVYENFQINEFDGNFYSFTGLELDHPFDGHVSDQPQQRSVRQSPVSTTTTLFLHRGLVFEELLTAFLNMDDKHTCISIKMILPNGVEESGEDFGGVFRDALSEFWSTFNEKCTVGTAYKVPFVRHDFNEEKWQAIALILYKGYIETSYFPIDLAPVFMEMCITRKFGSSLKDSFFGFISEQEKHILQSSILNFEETENEDLIDVLSNLECKIIPKKENINQLIDDLAHKELIQKPKFVIDCWNEVLNNMMSDSELSTLYIDKKICPKSLISILSTDTDPLTADEQKIYNFLKKFIRESDTKTLKQLLRFSTGADVLTNNKIRVSFNKKEGLMKLPTANTCGCNLQLPLNYDNFPEFRSELNAVLQSNVWVMDFV